MLLDKADHIAWPARGLFLRLVFAFVESLAIFIQEGLFSWVDAIHAAGEAVPVGITRSRTRHFFNALTLLIAEG